MDEMRFEWDDNKNILNQKKHEGVTFEEATTVFSDAHARLISDPEHSHGEERFILMGDVVNLFETIQLSYFFHFNQLSFKIIRTAIVQV